MNGVQRRQLEGRGPPRQTILAVEQGGLAAVDEVKHHFHDT
jgi:hypothetical protein